MRYEWVEIRPYIGVFLCVFNTLRDRMGERSGYPIVVIGCQKISTDKPPSRREDIEAIRAAMIGQNIVCRVLVELPCRKESERVVARNCIVFLKNGSPGFSGVGNIVRPRIDLASAGWRSVGLCHEHDVPTIERAKTSRMVLFPRGALNDDNQSPFSTCLIRSANVSRNVGS